MYILCLLPLCFPGVPERANESVSCAFPWALILLLVVLPYFNCLFLFNLIIIF